MLVKGAFDVCAIVFSFARHQQLFLYSEVTWAPWRFKSLRWRHNGHDSVLNHQPQDCLLNRLCRRRSKKTSKLRVTALCAGNSPGTGEFPAQTGEFPAQKASNAENVSIWWRHHVTDKRLFAPEIINVQHYWPFKGNPSVTNGSVMGKAVSYYDVIM